jgi:hypothetical protein
VNRAARPPLNPSHLSVTQSAESDDHAILLDHGVDRGTMATVFGFVSRGLRAETLAWVFNQADESIAAHDHAIRQVRAGARELAGGPDCDCHLVSLNANIRTLARRNPTRCDLAPHCRGAARFEVYFLRGPWMLLCSRHLSEARKGDGYLGFCDA